MAMTQQQLLSSADTKDQRLNLIILMLEAKTMEFFKKVENESKNNLPKTSLSY